jgi:hypothetical protein
MEVVDIVNTLVNKVMFLNIALKFFLPMTPGGYDVKLSIFLKARPVWEGGDTFLKC